MDLAVGIGQRDMVEVDQRDAPDRIARQRLGGPAAHAADADHAHMGRLQPCQAGGAIQARDAAETAVVVVVGRAFVGQRLGQARQMTGKVAGKVAGLGVCGIVHAEGSERGDEAAAAGAAPAAKTGIIRRRCQPIPDKDGKRATIQ
ncbi:hypothetical protein D3C72_1697760 [compost metagenome]